MFISFNLNEQKYFLLEEISIALSQIPNLQGMYCIGNSSKSSIKVNNTAADEYKQLREEHL